MVKSVWGLSSEFDRTQEEIVRLVGGTQRKGPTANAYYGSVYFHTNEVSSDEGRYLVGRISQTWEEIPKYKRGDTCYLTDVTLVQPVTRWLVDTAMGRFVGMSEGDLGQYAREEIPILMPITSVIGREIMTTVQLKLEKIAQPAAV